MPTEAAKLDSPRETATSTRATMGQQYRSRACTACVFATLGAIANIWGNPWADIAFVLTVTGMGLAVANAFGVPIHGRVKATARQGPGRDTQTGDGAGPGGGTGLPAHSEETGPGPSHDYGNRRAGQPDEALRPVAAERATRWIRPDIDVSLPLLEECLELRLAGGDLLSRRVTRGSGRTRRGRRCHPGIWSRSTVRHDGKP